MFTEVGNKIEFMKEKHYKELKSYINRRKPKLQHKLSIIRDGNIKNITKGFLTDQKHYALESYFVNNDLEQTKQHLNHCGLFFHFLLANRYENDDLWLPENNISFGFLSDNQKLIQATMQEIDALDKRDSKMNRVAFAMKNVYLNNLELLAEDVQLIDEVRADVWKENTDYHLSVFQGFLENDVRKIEAGINALSSDAYHKMYVQNWDTIRQFIMLPAIGYAKLAYLKGYELNIESKYIPKDWLPIQPIQEYTIPYDYVKEHCLKFDLV